MFAIVDIETTGGHAGANNITEIAIVLHNGYEVEGKYSTLVNPCMPIQKYVQGLTGITDAMVANAPRFEHLADNIYNLLKDRIFVAHNVNFDYSFVKHQLSLAGYELNTHKLCTIRLAKKIFPNLPKYGLGTVCRELNISMNDRHRASGDALATAELFSLLIQHDTSGELDNMVKKNANRYLPPHVSIDILEQMPAKPGVYYFHNKAGKVVYVGKAKNIKKRVISHFSNNKPSKQKQDFMREVHQISFTPCSSEFVASVLESVEIKRLWPAFNKSQKHVEHQFGIFTYEDVKGYLRLGIDKKKKILQPILSFGQYAEAHSTLWKWVNERSLHPALCALDRSKTSFPDLPSVATHNEQIKELITNIRSTKPSFLIQEPDHYYILVLEGRFYGMGHLTTTQITDNANLLQELLTPYAENEVVKSLISNYVEKNPHKLIMLN